MKPEESMEERITVMNEKKEPIKENAMKSKRANWRMSKGWTIKGKPAISEKEKAMGHKGKR